MPPSTIVPGVTIEEIPQGPRTIAALPTGIALFIGRTARGPRGPAQRVTGIAAFDAAFGPPDEPSSLGHPVAHFFANGGSVAWIVALDASPGTDAFHTALLCCFEPDGAVDAIARFDLLVVPGESDPATQAALQAFCAARHAFYIADCPVDATAASLAAGPDPRLRGAAASFAALVAPWALAPDRVTGRARPFPPSGFVAGVYARIDAAHGPWRSPAGTEGTLVGASGLTLPIDARLADTMNLAGIDALRVLPGRDVVVWGARTLEASGGDYRYVAVRRLASMIEASIVAGLVWTVFEPNDARLWASVRSSVLAFLTDLWRQGALVGARIDDACFVRCDATTMTQVDVDAGRLIVLIGIAPLRPAEFVVIRIGLCSVAP